MAYCISLDLAISLQQGASILLFTEDVKKLEESTYFYYFT